MLNNEETTDEHVAQPGENMDDLLITIRVNQHGEAQLGVNRGAVPIEILYFHLNFMAQALLQKHQSDIAEAYAERARILIPDHRITVPR